MVTVPTGRRPCATSSYCSGSRICRVVSSIGTEPSSRAYVRTRSARQQEDKDDLRRSKADRQRGHPTGVRCTDLHSETGSADVRRHPTPGDDRFAGTMSAREPNRAISDRAGSRTGEMPVHREAAWHRRPVVPAPTPYTTYPATTEAVGAARRQVVRIAQEAGATQAALTDIGLAVSEATTNAILHAYASTGSRGEAFTISTACKRSFLSVWITDEGQGGTPKVPSPGLGLGLQLMAQLCERVLIGVLKGGQTQVEMRFDLRSASRPDAALAQLPSGRRNGRP
jgi:anti-sigma regulatory factor (Ser/Thr protein kinase)